MLTATPQTTLLIRDKRTLLSLYQDILTRYPPISRSDSTTHAEWRFEVIRIVSTILAAALVNRMPLSSTLEQCAFAVRRNFVPFDKTFVYRRDGAKYEFDVNKTSDRQDPGQMNYAQSSLSSMVPPQPSTSSTTSSRSVSSVALSYNAASSISQYSSRTASSIKSDESPRIGQYNPNAYPQMPKMAGCSAADGVLQDLKFAMGRSDMSECWSDMAGVLLWVALTVGAASSKSDSIVLKKWFAALAMRISMRLCFEHADAIQSTYQQMALIVEGLSQSEAAPSKRS